MESLPTPAVAGDLRLATFAGGGYVNRLRRMVEAATGSRSREWTARALADAYGLPYRADGLAVVAGTLRLPLEGTLLRIQLKAQDVPSAARLCLDGRPLGEYPLRQADPANAYRTLTFRAPEVPGDRHMLTVTAAEGSVHLYRAEAYAGPCAVVNSGIGSCPTARYRAEYWPDYVAAPRPAYTVVEPHTINDWIAGGPPAAYAERLRGLFTDLRALGSAACLLTVAPILGDQRREGSPHRYEEYVAASREAAAVLGIPIADAHRAMTAAIAGLDEAAAFRRLYHDTWHVNDRGHQLYAQQAFTAIQPFLQTLQGGTQR